MVGVIDSSEEFSNSILVGSQIGYLQGLLPLGRLTVLLSSFVKLVQVFDQDTLLFNSKFKPKASYWNDWLSVGRLCCKAQDKVIFVDQDDCIVQLSQTSSGIDEKILHVGSSVSDIWVSGHSVFILSQSGRIERLNLAISTSQASVVADDGAVYAGKDLNTAFGIRKVFFTALQGYRAYLAVGSFSKLTGEAGVYLLERKGKVIDRASVPLYSKIVAAENTVHRMEFLAKAGTMFLVVMTGYGVAILMALVESRPPKLASIARVEMPDRDLTWHVSKFRGRSGSLIVGRSQGHHLILRLAKL